MSGTVPLRPGSWLAVEGEAVEVIALDGATVTVRDAAGKWQALGTAALYPADTTRAPRPGRPADP